MAEFDQIAPVYDETRGTLSSMALEALRYALARAGATTVVEVGVGTGRVSLPLQELGWQVTGVDVSNGMLEQARRKGLQRLVRADVDHLPFSDATFDCAVLAHVLHIFDDASAALRETARVTRGCVIAFLRSPSSFPRPTERRRRTWAYLQELRARYGLPTPVIPRRWWRESALLKAAPPIELTELKDSRPARSVEEWISAVEKRAYPGFSDLPDNALQEIVRELRSRARDLPAPMPRSERLAVWRPEQLRNLPPLLPEEPIEPVDRPGSALPRGS